MDDPNLFDYQDYRSFFKAVYEYRKQLTKKYSYRKFSTDLGFSASNYLHLVTIGKRNLSLEGIEKVKSHFTWTSQQKKYWHNLVLCNQAENKEDKEKYEEELSNILGKKRQLLDPDQYSYFSKWYIPVLREIVSLKNFVSNLNWISKKLRPRIDEALVKEGLKILERLKMIRKVKNKWEQSKEHLSTSTEVTSTMVHNYHKEMITLAIQALDCPMDQRNIASMTMSLSDEQFEWLKHHVTDVLNDVQQQLQNSKDNPSMVAQLNIQMFSVTEK